LTRIAYVYAGNAPVFGRRGASVHMQEVIRALTRRGGRVEIVARRLGGDRLPGLEATPVHTLSRAGGGGRGGRRAWDDTNREVRERLAEIGPVDLVYERFSLGSVGGMEHARATGSVGVLEMNGPRIEKAAARGALDEPEEAERAAARAVDAAAVVVAVSEPVAAYARTRFPGVNVTTIPNGVDPGRFPPELLEARQAATRPFTVGFVGTFKAHHGLDTLVDAFASLRRAERDARLLLVGEGPALSSVRGRLEELGLSGAARFTGAVPPDQVPSLLSEMDVGVAPYPTRRSYVSPLKVFEYLAAGLPVVASGADQIAELVGDGEAGLLVDPESPAALAGALQELASQPERRAQLGRAGRDKVLASHTWDAVAARILGFAEPDARPSHA
jgi:glycosyltransferase involved in cell wall biosynthesis